MKYERDLVEVFKDVAHAIDREVDVVLSKTKENNQTYRTAKHELRSLYALSMSLPVNHRNFIIEQAISKLNEEMRSLEIKK